MNLRALVQPFAKHLAAQGAATRTAAAYERSVAGFLAVTSDRTPKRTDVEAFLARTRDDGRPRSASTKRAELLALRAFFRFAASEGAILDPTDGLAVKRERRPDPPVAMPEDVPRLFEAAANSRMPARNTAILGLFHVLGLRVHELAALDAAQVDLAALVLRRVRGKGGTVTDFPLPLPLATLLHAWLRERSMLGHGLDDGPLFPTARPASSRTGRLSIRSLQRLVNRLAKDAGLGRRLGPHALRHGTATAAISLGIDVPTTAEVMRHASLVTTQGYVHLAQDARKGALEKIASLIPKSAIPESTLIPRKQAENAENRGVADAVDIHPLLHANTGSAAGQQRPAPPREPTPRPPDVPRR